jgi:predicted esterase
MKQCYPLLLMLFLASGTSLFAQDAEGCDGQRYFYTVVDDIQKTTVMFGENINSLGLNQELFMDVYEPVNDDVEKRPAIVWAYGGGFILGSRDDVAEACMEFAGRGYVAVAFDYRLYSIFLGIPDSLDVLDAVAKATADMKAVVRELRLDADTDNVFNIDPDRIIAAGASAGAITACHLAYLDEDDNMPDYVLDALEDNGGIEGNTGDMDNLSYPSDVMAVVNLSGSLYRSEWMEAGEAPLSSYHGTEDEIVPYNFGIAMAPIDGVDIEFISMEGSGNLHMRADEVGIPNYLLSVEGGGHEDVYFDPIYEDLRNQFTEEGGQFLYDLLCPDTPLGPSSTAEIKKLAALEVYPNPSVSDVTVEVKGVSNEPYTLRVFDNLGREVLRYNNLRIPVSISRAQVGQGLFWIDVDFENPKIQDLTSKVVFK